MVSLSGWLDEFTRWLKDALLWLFNGFVDLVKGLVLAIVHMVLDAVLYIVALIPVPAFFTDHSIGTMLGSAGPVIGWLGGTLHLADCFALIAAGYAFRLLRKLLTLGQW